MAILGVYLGPKYENTWILSKASLAFMASIVVGLSYITDSALLLVLSDLLRNTRQEY